MVADHRVARHPPVNRWIWLLALLPALGEASALERGNGPEPDSLDPHRAQGLSAQHILRDLFEPLVRERAGGEIQLAAAESVQVSDDGLIYTFQLRTDGRYNDGAPVTAADFQASFERALQATTGAPYAAMLAPIRGATGRLNGGDGELCVEAIDTLTLQICLEAPRGDFLRRLALPIAMPVPKRMFASGARMTRPGVLLGNGAYQLSDWVPQSAITLTRNPHYRQPPAIERVRYHVTEDAAQELKRFAAGELHLTDTIPPGSATRLRAEFGDQLRIAPAYATFFLGFNLRQPALANPALREALSLAIDRDVLTRYITGNGELPAYSLLPNRPLPASATAAQFQSERAQRARALFASAGFHRDTAPTIELRYNTSLLNRRLGLAVAAMWREVLGVHTRLRHEEWRSFVVSRREARVTMIYRGGWFGDYQDPVNFLEPFTQNHALNATGFADEPFDLLVTQAAAGIDAAGAIDRAESRLLHANVLIPLFQYTSKHLVSDQLCGFEAHPLDHHPSSELRFCGTP